MNDAAHTIHDNEKCISGDDGQMLDSQNINTSSGMLCAARYFY